jgi:hypothetical protein
MVDKPGLAIPYQQIRIAMRPVGVGDECVEPDDPRGKLGRYELTGRRSVEVESSVEVSNPDIDAMACTKEILNDSPTSISASSGVGSPAACARSPTMSSAMSDLAPCPAPRNFATNKPPP